MKSKLLAIVLLSGMLACEHGQTEKTQDRQETLTKTVSILNLNIKESSPDVIAFLKRVSLDTDNLKKHTAHYTGRHVFSAKFPEKTLRLGKIKRNSGLYLFIVPDVFQGIEIKREMHSSRNCSFETNIPFSYERPLLLQDKFKNIVLEMGRNGFNLEKLQDFHGVDYSWIPLGVAGKEALQITIRDLSQIKEISYGEPLILNLYPEMTIGKIGVKLHLPFRGIDDGCMKKTLDIAKKTQTGFLPDEIHYPYCMEGLSLFGIKCFLSNEALKWFRPENEKKVHYQNYSASVHAIVTTP